MNVKSLPAHPVNYVELDEITLDYAIERMKARHPKGDLLEALIALEADHKAMVDATWFADDPEAAERAYDEWLWDYCYEIAYFNLICREFAPLFAPKEAA